MKYVQSIFTLRTNKSMIPSTGQFVTTTTGSDNGLMMSIYIYMIRFGIKINSLRMFLVANKMDLQ